MVGHGEEEDLAQDLFMRLWEGKLHVREAGDFKAAGGLLRYWTALQAANHHRHWRCMRRDRAREVPLSQLSPAGGDHDGEERDDHPLTPRSTEASPETRTYENERRRVIVAVLTAFEKPTRRVAIGWFLREQTGPEIAAEMGRSRGWVAWTVAAAKQSLRRELSPIYRSTGVRACRGKSPRSSR